MQSSSSGLVMVGLQREKGVLERISDGWFLMGKRKGEQQ